MIVWIASYPRSGNTFFRLLLNHLHGIRSFSVYEEGEDQHGRPLFPNVFKNEGDASLGKFRDVVGSRERPPSLAELHADDKTHFIKTHDLPPDQGSAVYLIRDGRDALVSYAHFLGTFFPDSHNQEKFQSVLQKLIEGQDTYGSWDQHVTKWFDRKKNVPTAWVRYEELIREPIATAAAALQQLNIQLPKTAERFPSFEELHAKWPFFFRKGKNGSWREEMSEDQQKLFWERHGSVMTLHGYNREGISHPV